jgi:hypothetical protein
MALPDALVLNGFGTWYNDVEFAVEKFPFPERKRETIPFKYLNQTNHLLGAETATAPITITIRYAFNQATAQLLERWNYLTSHPLTGGVGLTSQVKARGEFIWLIPNMVVQKNVESTSPSDDTLVPGLIYVLEGCMVTGLKWSDADMTVGTETAKLMFDLSIDRYYPKDLRKMIVGNSNVATTQNTL